MNYLIFKAKHWTPAFAGVTATRVFYCKVGISIIFQHQVRVHACSLPDCFQYSIDQLFLVPCPIGTSQPEADHDQLPGGDD